VRLCASPRKDHLQVAVCGLHRARQGILTVLEALGLAKFEDNPEQKQTASIRCLGAWTMLRPRSDRIRPGFRATLPGCGFR
jgi:hypothetical protein